jgi:hypothetical protein
MIVNVTFFAPFFPFRQFWGLFGVKRQGLHELKEKNRLKKALFTPFGNSKCTFSAFFRVNCVNSDKYFRNNTLTEKRKEEEKCLKPILFRQRKNQFKSRTISIFSSNFGNKSMNDQIKTGSSENILLNNPVYLLHRTFCQTGCVFSTKQCPLSDKLHLPPC